MKWQDAPDVKKTLSAVVKKLELSHIDLQRIFTFRSFGSKSKAWARIWSFPRVWQQALSLPPYYIIEVISERFDRLSDGEKTKVLIHELLHIPKNFSGCLLSHNHRGKRIDAQRVKNLFQRLKNS